MGLLAKANRGILYVDEINLLDDYLVDILLDSAASGWNTVEREGISLRHPSSFVLVGSGNPEEGELRPQLLDRFGMQAEILTEKDQKLRDRIVAAQQLLLSKVKIDYEFRIKISEICSRLDVDGLRGDIVTTRAAQAHAAYHNRNKVTVDDISKTIVLCLRHRLRKDPLDYTIESYKVEKVFKEIFEIEE